MKGHHMRFALVGICVALAATSGASAQAGRCSYHTDGVVWQTYVPAGPHSVVWCEDFDNYCIGGAEWLGYPPYPDKCAETGSTPSNAVLFQKWPLDDTSSPNYITQGVGASAIQAESLPFTLMLFGGETNYRANRATHNLATAVQQINPAKNAVNGTDERPLILEVTLNFSGPPYGESTDPYYIELTASGDQAPVDYILQPCYNNADGADCSIGQAEPNCGPWPTICQQYRQGNGGVECSPSPTLCKGIDACTANVTEPCGPLKEEIHASLAFGSLAWLDPSPADRQSTGRKPTRDHVVFFDGRAWRELRQSVYAGAGNFQWRASNPMPNIPAPFRNRFRITIRTSTFFLEHWNPDNLYSWAFIPRQYTGPFDTVAVGTGNGCEIDPVTHECKGPREPIGAFTGPPVIQDGRCVENCLDRQGRGWWNADVDNLILLDGVTASVDGACCKPDGTCAVLPIDQCVPAGGLFRGAATTCETAGCMGACCDNFGGCTDKVFGTCQGTFQGVKTTCAANGCPCAMPWADSDQDQDVDADDFGRFQACFNPVGITPGCQCYDRNADGLVDGQDFLKFQSCATGPNVLLTPEETAACEAP